MLDLTPDQVLATTRSVRKRLDFSRPVAPELIEECLEIALQAPTGSNAQGWHWLVVTDPEKKRAIQQLYQKAFRLYAADDSRRPQYADDDPRAAQQPRVYDSASYLADHLHEAPVWVVPCVEGRVEKAGVVVQASVYGSILPAVWSLMLALRARGLGSAWTTLHLAYEREVAGILGVPDGVTQAALLPVAYYTGDGFRRARRLPARGLTYWDAWGATR